VKGVGCRGHPHAKWQILFRESPSRIWTLSATRLAADVRGLSEEVRQDWIEIPAPTA